MEGHAMKIVITGAGGLIGWHAAVRIHAANCAARFQGQNVPFDLVMLDHAGFDDDARLNAAINDADAILHFAGINRAADEVVETANPAIARRLVQACNKQNATPHIVYANSTHADSDTPYGRSKRIAGEILARSGGPYTDLMLPHIFGECARPRYNNVTATFIEAVIQGTLPKVNPDGSVMLLHAGTASQAAIDAVHTRSNGAIQPDAQEMPVTELLKLLQGFHADYMANVFPDLSAQFTLQLFNTYRVALYPDRFPLSLTLKKDARGTLFEAAKGGGGGQTFCSTTKPGVTRGDHFHLDKVERFLVIQGEATIRIRKVLSNTVWEYHVSGEQPTPVDIPTLHTHSIENTGNTELRTLFWTHEQFDPTNPDTFADQVLQ